MLTINICYLYLLRRLMLRLRELTVGRAASAASARSLATLLLPTRFLGLRLNKEALKASRLPV
jgi:hypothetical protein